MICAEMGHLFTGIKLRTTEKKRTQDLLDLDRSKTDFFHKVSHELRTPLTLILGPLEEVLSTSDDLSEDVMNNLQVSDLFRNFWKKSISIFRNVQRCQIVLLIVEISIGIVLKRFFFRLYFAGEYRFSCGRAACRNAVAAQPQRKNSVNKCCLI